MGRANDRVMGERLTERQLRLHPLCVYCGGSRPAVETDHVPPKAVFKLKLRPQGLEFSACAACHKGTRHIDAVAALTARSWPNLQTEEEREELKRLMGGVLRNVPPVAYELHRGFTSASTVPPELAAVLGGQEVITIDFTVTRAILDAFGARIALAMHYDLTGRPLPEAGGVWVRTYSNTEQMRGEALPSELGHVLGPTLALMQKGLTAEDDFQFARRHLDDYAGTASFSTFRQSFALLAAAYPDADDFPSSLRDDLFRPGFLVGFPL